MRGWKENGECRGREERKACTCRGTEHDGIHLWSECRRKRHWGKEAGFRCASDPSVPRERKDGREKIMQLIPVWFYFVSFICYPECLREAWLVSIARAKKYRVLSWRYRWNISLSPSFSCFPPFAYIKRSKFPIAVGSHLKRTWY